MNFFFVSVFIILSLVNGSIEDMRVVGSGLLHWDFYATKKFLEQTANCTQVFSPINLMIINSILSVMDNQVKDLVDEDKGLEYEYKVLINATKSMDKTRISFSNGVYGQSTSTIYASACFFENLLQTVDLSKVFDEYPQWVKHEGVNETFPTSNKENKSDEPLLYRSFFFLTTILTKFLIIK